MFPLVYFSSQSENTHRFVTRLGGLPPGASRLMPGNNCISTSPIFWSCPAMAVAAVAVRCPVR